MTLYQSVCHTLPIRLSHFTNLSVTLYQSVCHTSPIQLSHFTNPSVTLHQSGCHTLPIRLSHFTNPAVTLYQLKQMINNSINIQSLYIKYHCVAEYLLVVIITTMCLCSTYVTVYRKTGHNAAPFEKIFFALTELLASRF